MMTVALLLSLLAPCVQNPPPDDVKTLLAKKLQSPFLKSAPWMLDYDAALKKAAERNVPVFAYFTRSYAH
jgi:hypothetical protein